jgi:hypothetical protein
MALHLTSDDRIVQTNNYNFRQDLSLCGTMLQLFDAPGCERLSWGGTRLTESDQKLPVAFPLIGREGEDARKIVTLLRVLLLQDVRGLNGDVMPKPMEPGTVFWSPIGFSSSKLRSACLASPSTLLTVTTSMAPVRRSGKIPKR